MVVKVSVLCLLISLQIHLISSQSGPDPWNSNGKPPEINDEANLPPDIRMPLKKKFQTENRLALGEWFFRRLLTIILKGGQSQANEDGTTDISLQMKFDPSQWKVLEEALQSDSPLSEDMLRRSIGYVQESIYTPTIVEKIVMAWSDYIAIYLTEYKTHITWTFGMMAAAGGIFWLWRRMSHKHVIILVFVIFYAYEVFVSYKEAEQKELDKFLSAVHHCKWFFWQSTCEVPPPDPLIFLKHMNPQKIAVRMFTTSLSEFFVALSGIVEVMLHGITDGLWYPFDKITYALLIFLINISLIFFLAMVIFNWIFNIPFNLNFLGLIGIGFRQRARNLNKPTSTNIQNTQQPIQNGEQVNNAILNKMLDVFQLALTNNAQTNNNTRINRPLNSATKSEPIRRSASTGRLPNLASNNYLALNNLRNRHDGSGDA